MNDFFIAAQAAMTGDVKTLYTFDGGILSLNGMLQQCTPAKPPHPHGALFEHAQNVVRLQKKP